MSSAKAEATSDLVVKIRKSHADAMMALAADVHPYSGQAVRDHEEAHEEALVALATRLRQAERERDEARRAMQYYHGRAQAAEALAERREAERDDLLHAMQEIWDDWCSGHMGDCNCIVCSLTADALNIDRENLAGGKA